MKEAIKGAQPSTKAGAILFLVTALLELAKHAGFVTAELQPHILGVFNACIALWAIMRDEKT